MAHIHSEGMIHSDLAARNILVSLRGETLVAKISDFGHAEFLPANADSIVKSKSPNKLNFIQFVKVKKNLL